MDKGVLQSNEFLGLFDLDNKRFHLFTDQPIILGRDPNCNLHIDDNSVSAKHAKLSYQHMQWWVQDLGSKNGTYINHGMLSEAVALTSGDIIQIGKRNYEIVLESKENESRF